MHEHACEEYFQRVGEREYFQRVGVVSRSPARAEKGAAPPARCTGGTLWPVYRHVYQADNAHSDITTVCGGRIAV
jgi:hypothetical protein